jgi:hypothetical protein
MEAKRSQGGRGKTEVQWVIKTHAEAWVLWLMPVIPATQEVVGGGSRLRPTQAKMRDAI